MHDRHPLIDILTSFCGIALAIYFIVSFVKISDDFATERVEVASIDLSNETEGDFHRTFAIGYGSVETKTYYVLYKKLSDGGLSLVKIPADKTVIYQTLSKFDTAYYEITTNGFEDIVGIKLYVPKGSITCEYNLNLSDL